MHFWLLLKSQRLKLAAGAFPGLGGGVTADLPHITSPGEASLFLSSAEQSLAAHSPPLGCSGSAGISRSRRIAPELTRGPSPQLGVNKLALKVTSSGSGSSGPEEAAIIFQGCKCQRGTH